jgi:transposase-like protein
MSKRYLKQSKSARGNKDDKTGNVYQLPLRLVELNEAIREGLHEFAVSSALLLAKELLKDEVEQLCGPQYGHNKERGHFRHGSQKGVISVGGQKVPIERPRVRSKDGKREQALSIYETLQGENSMPEAVLRRLVRGVSTRDYEGVIDVACEGFGVKKSSVSRQFIRGSIKALEELRARRFDDVRFAAVLIDGVEFADELIVAAIGISEDGIKQVLGLRQGATENAEVTTSLLEELTERGLNTAKPTLFVIDGSKALPKAIKRVFGKRAFIQRCQLHKKRNIRAHLSDELWEQTSKRLNDAYSQESYKDALRMLKTTLAWLRRVAPDAAASLAEGMEETLTVVRLAVPPALRKSLSSTNIIESAFSGTRKLTSRVKCWRDGDMRLRWAATGLLKVEQSFRRVRGYREIPALLSAMDRACDSQKFDLCRKAA